jgi:hypothetical protein
MARDQTVPRRAGALKRAAALAAAAVALSIGLAGCGLGAQSAPQPLGLKTLPHGLLGPASPPSTLLRGRASARVTIFLEGSNEHLVPVRREVPLPATLASILRMLVAGPRRSESDRGLVSPASSVGPFAVGPVHKGVVSVNLPVSFENLEGQDQTVAAAQIVFTATTFSGVEGVRFLVGGQAAQVPNGDGSLTPGPSTRKDYSVLAG